MTGFDPVKETVEEGSAALILLAIDLSQKTKKEVQYILATHPVEIRDLPFDMTQIEHAIGKRAGVLAVCDGGLAKKIARTIDADREHREDTI